MKLEGSEVMRRVKKREKCLKKQEDGETCALRLRQTEREGEEAGAGGRGGGAKRVIALQQHLMAPLERRGRKGAQKRRRGRNNEGAVTEVEVDFERWMERETKKEVEVVQPLCKDCVKENKGRE